MIKLPLKKQILLITYAGDILCNIEYAGKDILKCKDAHHKIFTEDGDYFFSKLDGDNDDYIFIERNQIIGYHNIKNENIKNNKILNSSNNKIIDLKSFKKQKES